LFLISNLDRCSKRWDSDVSILTNLSLLSVSNKSKISDDDDDLNDILNSQLSKYEDSSSASSRANSPQQFLNESQIHQQKRSELDSYIFDKHLHGIPSTHSDLIELDIDPSLNDLFDDSKTMSQLNFDDCSARSIRPPPFIEHIKQIKESQMKSNVNPRRLTRASIRSANKSKSIPQQQQQPIRREQTSLSRHSVISSMKNLKIPRSTSVHGFQQALKTTTPLLLSPLLVKQMREDIKCSRGKQISQENEKLIFLFSSSCIF